MFVKIAENFDAEVRVTGGTCGEPCDGTSILDLLMLAAGPGTTITVTASYRPKRQHHGGDHHHHHHH